MSGAIDPKEARAALVVQAAAALREGRLDGALGLLVAAGYGVMVSKPSEDGAGKVEVDVHDLAPNSTAPVGSAINPKVSTALLEALKPFLERAGRRDMLTTPKLRGIRGGRAIDKHRTPTEAQRQAATIEEAVLAEQAAHLPENAGAHEAPKPDGET